MATYVLDENSSVYLPRGPVAVNLTTSQQNPPVQLTAKTLTGNPVRTVSSSASLLILPSITEETVVGAVPDHGYDRFPAGTVLNVSLSPDGAPGAVTDSAALAPRDVSGLTRVDLASLTPGSGDRLVVRTLLAVEDAALPPVAAAARIAGRGVLGIDRVSPAESLDLRCLIDASASMAEPFARRAVAACGDLVAGLNAVVSTETTIDYAVLGQGGGLQRTDPAALGDALAAPPAGGFGLGTPLRDFVSEAVAPRTVTIVITDGVGIVPPPATHPDRPVLTLAITDVRSPEVFVGPTAICRPAASDQHDIRAFLATRPDAVHAVVAELLTPLRTAGLLP